MQRPVMSHQRLIRELFFKVDGTGTAAIDVGGSAGSLVDNGTGDYTITFGDLFKGQRAVVAHVTPITDDTVPRVNSFTATAVNVKVYDLDETAAAKDGDFYLTCVLSDDPDDR